ncbi:MAG TPA: TetR/AcrR family transcriptional regulator [Candidatus Cloacimonetes bacterium]|nr:TetR/AcrR family transcriptional regulator [Candidatus Cloacimonadota bacterium]
MIKEMKQQLIKDAIVNETKKQFLEKGINKTTLRAVAKELGIAVGNIYYYFKSKDDICGIIWCDFTHEYLDQFDAQLQRDKLKNKSGLDKLRHYYKHLFDYFENNPLYADIIAFSMGEKPRYMRSPKEIKKISKIARTRIQKTLVDLYNEGIKDGSIKAEIPNVWYEAWSFNISYVAIIINIIRYHEIGEDVYDYYVTMYMNRLAKNGG